MPAARETCGAPASTMRPNSRLIATRSFVTVRSFAASLAMAVLGRRSRRPHGTEHAGRRGAAERATFVTGWRTADGPRHAAPSRAARAYDPLLILHRDWERDGARPRQVSSGIDER